MPELTLSPRVSRPVQVALTPQLYINRELSWLEFNSRVLHEAFDTRNPLLERLKFAAIFSTNLDEFYMVRVAGLRRQLAANVTVSAPDGLSPQDQLDAISARVRQLLAQQQRLIHDELLPTLSDRGVRLVTFEEELTAAELKRLDEYFEKQVYPVLTPLAVDPGHPFPYISNLSLSLAVEIRDPDTQEDHFARVKVPRSLPRWIPFGRPNQFIPLEQLIGINLRSLFPGMEVRNWYAFRITRNSDIELLTSEEPDDLLETIEAQVFLRRFGEVVRLEVQTGTPPEMRALLVDELRDDRLPPNATLTEADVHEMGPLLELGDLRELASLDIPELRDPPIVLALTEAAESGKQVVVLVELKARFDEANNITWARQLESAGVHVVYGMMDLKTHTKTCLVVRREADGIRRYVHVGTGNYNSKTARQYLSLIHI